MSMDANLRILVGEHDDRVGAELQLGVPDPTIGSVRKLLPGVHPAVPRAVRWRPWDRTVAVHPGSLRSRGRRLDVARVIRGSPF